MTYLTRSVSGLAITAMLACGPAMAQTESETQPQDESADVAGSTQGTAQSDISTDATAEDAGTGAASDNTGESDVADSSEGDPQSDTGADVAAEDTSPDAEAVATGEAGGTIDGAIPMQSEDSVLAGDLLGSAVYNMNEESVGDINDMIVNFDGSVEGVIIGVGGFLGIGEKEVAISLSAIDLKMNEAGNPRLYLDRSAEELKAADAFVTAEDQRIAKELEQSQADALNSMSGADQNAVGAQDAVDRAAEDGASQ